MHGARLEGSAVALSIGAGTGGLRCVVSTFGGALKDRWNGALMRQQRRRWNDSAGRFLLDAIGSFGWSVLERKSAHTKTQIQDFVRYHFGGGGITRGSYSLAQAMVETGYSRSQFARAAKALNQRWLRTARGGNFLITAEQLEDMAAWLKQDFWCPKHHLYKCIDCATTERPHFSMGMCVRCYRRVERYMRALGLETFSAANILALLDLLRPDAVPEDVRSRLEAGRCPPLEQIKKVVAP